MQVDVVVVGGGITGLTAAYLLKRAGLKVAVLERDRCGGGDTGHTTAHVTCVTDRRLGELVSQLGDDHARAVWEAGEAAIQQIREIACTEKIECKWHTVPAFVHAPLNEPRTSDNQELEDEAHTAQRLGFDAQFIDDIPLIHACGMRVSHQALFHPVKYLMGLAGAVHGDGSHVFECSEVTAVDNAPLAVHVNGHVVRCDHVVIATHVPLMGKTAVVKATLLQTRIYPYSTYAVGARVARGMAAASFFDTADPYHYLRVEPTEDGAYAILGGKDHKTGQSDDVESRFAALRKMMQSILPGAQVDSQWSGQVIESHDGLPLIGETSERQYVATGFAGNGMTFGTLGAMMISDAILKRGNPWQELFDVHRTRLRGGTWDYLKENLDYPYYMVKDRLTRAEGTSTEAVRPGQGMILRINGQRVAASRSVDGALSLLSPACTHMGCFVRWNSSERTWDCPCHGSRFHPGGRVLAGPAETPLPAVEVEENAETAG
jgi:glycine/D-amino acid oxidase-like deaminating enzyme/nitrite reductase/ring-hydroxylating ferredoxin subunit